MSGKKLVTVSIPKNLLIEVDTLITKTDKYVSRADFCRSAVRLLIEKELSKIETNECTEVAA